MKKFIGYVQDNRELTEAQLEKTKQSIKRMLNLDTIEIGSPEMGIFYPVSTDDVNIIDFKLDSYDNDKVSLVKYNTLDEEGNRIKGYTGAILTCPEIKCKE
jgi:hypothetical protein